MNGFAAPNGYAALAEFNQFVHSGNGDAVLSAADAVWQQLMIWIDRDHDGISDTGELMAAGAAGLIAIDTRYKRSNKLDRHGNLFRFRADALIRTAKGTKTTTTYDVYFAD